MRLVLLLLVACPLAFGTCNVAIGRDAGDMPKLIHHPESQYPLWVSAENAAKDTGLNADVLFPEGVE
jgi:hypothetical protein